MRPPAKIRDWLGINQMFQWLQSAPDEASHRRRMAIWLTHTGNLHAGKVAEILGVSTQSVWLWIRQYNESGPAGLDRQGRGGRRWGYLTAEQEIELLGPMIEQARAGDPPKPKAIRLAIEQRLNQRVTMSYVYRLLRRHGWSSILAQSRLAEPGDGRADTFERISTPWRRHT